MKNEPRNISLERELFLILRDIDVPNYTLSKLFNITSKQLLECNPKFDLKLLSRLLFRIKHGEITSEKERLIKRVKYLDTVPQPPQRTPEWYTFRKGRITASVLASIVGLSPYRKQGSFIYDKCRRDGEEKKFNDFAKSCMQHGNRYEEVANLIYQNRTGRKVKEYGCIPHDEHYFLGASPDGITPEGVMIEIKCPVRRDITGIQPLYYWCQVQLQLEVAELNECDFVEVKILEYNTEEDFISDYSLFDDTKTCDELEKGGILEYQYEHEPGKSYYKYLPINLNAKKTLKELERQRDELSKDDTIIYIRRRLWYITKYSCVSIYRDTQWFQSIMPILRDCWSKVEHLRSLDQENFEIEFKKYKPKKRFSKRKNIFQEKCLIDSSDDDKS